MTSGNPAIGQPQGVGEQPYADEQSPRMASSTLGGVRPDLAAAAQVAAVQALLDATVLDGVQNSPYTWDGSYSLPPTVEPGRALYITPPRVTPPLVID